MCLEFCASNYEKIKILKNYLEKNKTSPLLKTPEKDFQGSPEVINNPFHIKFLKVSLEEFFSSQN